MKNNHEHSPFIDSMFKVECFQQCSLRNYDIILMLKNHLFFCVAIDCCNSHHCHIVGNLGLKKQLELISLDNILNPPHAPASY